MIITKTPFRMSFFGGGTDLPEFFNKYQGAVISTTFDKYVYVTVRHLPRFFDYSNEIFYSKTERVNHVDEINHPIIERAGTLVEPIKTIKCFANPLYCKQGVVPAFFACML